jgi:hypothetical protein
MYREADEMVIVALPNKHMPVRMYIPLCVVMQMEAGISESTRVAMEFEEAQCRAFYKHEQSVRSRELEDMRRDEVELKRHLHFEAEVRCSGAFGGFPRGHGRK